MSQLFIATATNSGNVYPVASVSVPVSAMFRGMVATEMTVGNPYRRIYRDKAGALFAVWQGKLVNVYTVA